MRWLLAFGVGLVGLVGLGCAGAGSAEPGLAQAGPNQERDGLRVGRWIGLITDHDDVVYDVVTDYGPEQTLRTWTRRDTGKLVLTESLKGQDEYAVRHGPSIWEGGPTVQFYEGEPDPAFMEDVWTERRPRIKLKTNDVLEVLDVDPEAGRVAFRVLLAHGPESQAHACAYPGVSDPEGGVELGTLDVATGEVHHWRIYDLAHEAKECSDEAGAARRLAMAKAHMTTLGLDPSRKPAITPAQGSRVQVAGRTVTLTTERVGPGPISQPELYAIPFDSEIYTAVGRWSGLDTPRVPLFVSSPHRNGMSEELELVGAWEEGGHGLVAWRGSNGFNSSWGFVPVR
jgi:hypothetical protein